MAFANTCRSDSQHYLKHPPKTTFIFYALFHFNFSCPSVLSFKNIIKCRLLRIWSFHILKKIFILSHFHPFHMGYAKWNSYYLTKHLRFPFTKNFRGKKNSLRKTPISSSFFFLPKGYFFIFLVGIKIKGVHVIFPLNFFHLILSHYLQNEGLSYKVLTLWWR